ncbi:MAG: hypothetical protein QW569_02790 [Candidatus Bathyarchaeia archaeon]|nr:hypothetical protein [Candidatus Bathyarchaeota archaeon]
MLGIGELVLIGVVLLILFLPGLLNPRRPAAKTLRLYMVIAILGVIVLILSRAVISLFGKVLALSLLLAAIVAALAARLLMGSR